MNEGQKKSGAKEKKAFDFNAIMQQVGKAVREVNSLSKIVDKVLVDLMPKLYKEKVDEAYTDTNKALGYIIRHII
jgi:hypothetical protein